MANKVFLRIGAWYRASEKFLPSDIEITNIIENPDAQYPVTEDGGGGGGGEVSIPATAYASNAEAVAALGVGVLYKSTTSIGPDGNGSPIILITV